MVQRLFQRSINFPRPFQGPIDIPRPILKPFQGPITLQGTFRWPCDADQLPDVRGKHRFCRIRINSCQTSMANQRTTLLSCDHTMSTLISSSGSSHKWARTTLDSGSQLRRAQKSALKTRYYKTMHDFIFTYVRFETSSLQRLFNNISHQKILIF